MMEAALQCHIAEGEIGRLFDPAFLFNCVASGQDALGVFLGAVFAVVAWLMKAVVQALVSYLRRRQDLKEIIIAMIANLERSAEDYRTKFDDGSRDRIIARIKSAAQAGRVLVPFSVAVPEDFILDRIKERISILPERLVEPVTRYIYAADLVTAAVIDFRSPAFAELDAARKAAHVANVYAIATENGVLGGEIVALLKRQRRFMRGAEWIAASVAALGAMWCVRWVSLHQW